MKEKKKHILLLTMFTAFLTVILFMPWPLSGGPLEPPIGAVDSSGNPVPTMHSLEDIYRVDLNTRLIQYCVFQWGRFHDLSDGTVYDCKTGLVFLKDAYCLGKTNWDDAMDGAASLQDGMCGLSDGSAPGDWRLPGIAEWEEFVDNRYDNPCVSNTKGDDKWSEGDPFFRVRNVKYWSSDIGSDDPSRAYVIHMQWCHTNVYPRDSIYEVWPVRGSTGR